MASESFISRLYELLFIHAIRIYTNDSKQGNGGWLAGISDKSIGPIARKILVEINKAWTIEMMAQEAGMSRSAFAVKFKNVVGQTPLEYVTEWRIFKAVQMIRRKDISISEVALAVGYESESAFNKVFKREVGMTPGQFRKMENLLI